MHDPQPVFIASPVSIGARLAIVGPTTRDSINAGFVGPDERDYRPRLPTSQLVAEVRESRRTRATPRVRVRPRLSTQTATALGAEITLFHDSCC
jgi:hypothetical protein